MVPDITFSVVVCTYNRKSKDIIDCFHSLINQNYPFEEFELIIVDDGSKYPEIETALEEVSIPSKLFVNTIYAEHGGVVSARNHGWKNARGKWVAFTDDDCLPVENWLKSLGEFINDSNVGGIGGPVLSTVSENIVGKFSNHSNYLFSNIIESNKRDVLFGGNCCYRRDVLNKVGGFNEQFTVYCALGLSTSYEDDELSSRVLSTGYDLINAPFAVVTHRPRKSMKKLFKQWHGYGEGALAYCKITGIKENTLEPYPIHKKSRQIVNLIIRNWIKTYKSTIDSGGSSYRGIQFAWLDFRQLISFYRGFRSSVKVIQTLNKE